jgi:hypothetical protein
MKIAKIISFLGVIAMTVALINGFVQGDFGTEGSWIISNPWGIVSLVDLYVGFILFAMWMFYREKSKISAVIWIVLLMVLGFFIGALYVFIQLMKSNNDWHYFFLGDHANDLKQTLKKDES